MFITQMALPRRTFLRGVGASLALPLLDAMVPALSAMAQSAANPVRRLGFVYLPNGVARNFSGINYWTPTGEGSAFDLSPILSPLAPFRDRLLVVSGLAQHQADAFDDGANGDHTRGTSSWLTGVHCKRTEGADVKNGISADQVAAAELGRGTALPSLELSIDLNFLAGQCENSYSCAYLNTLAWRTPTAPLPTENNPRIVFERLFGDGGTSAQRLAQAKENRSILDSVMDDLARLQKSLGPADRTMVGEYLDSVREVERRIHTVETRGAESELPTLDRPAGIPDRFDEHVKLMYELQWLAFRADITRVTTFMLGRELNFRTYPEIGITEGHHGLSHHSDNPVQLAKYAKLNTYQTELFGWFLEKLQSTPEGDGTLLDHSLFLYGAGLSNPNLHAHYDLPLALVGGGAGTVKGGRHLVYRSETPMTNLLLSMLDKVGVRTEALGDSTGRIPNRTAVGCMKPGIGTRGSLLAVKQGGRVLFYGPAVMLILFSAGVAFAQVSLVDAVKRGDAATVQALLAKKVDPNVTDADGTTALHWAVQRNDARIADLLIRQGARVQATNRYSVTPLYLAAVNGNAAIAERLLASGASANTMMPDGETALMTAARTGSVETVKALLARGARVKDKELSKGQDALMWAAAENNPDVVRVLVEAGADIQARSRGGAFTPYLFAVRGGHIEASRALIDAGADVNQALPDGTSALVLAVVNAHYELAAFLLDKGADANADGQGWTALHQIAWSRRHNAGFNLPGPVATGGLDSLDLVRKLVQRGANVNARVKKEPRDGNRNQLNRIGATPFVMAAKNDDVPMMRVLLENHADPSLTTDRGTTALMVAAGVGIWAPGENPGTHEEALAAATLALEVGGGGVNDVDLDGETALHGAVYRGGAIPVIQLLIDKGAKLDVQNKKGWLPVTVADGVEYTPNVLKRYPEAAALLRQAMRDRGLTVPESSQPGSSSSTP